MGLITRTLRDMGEDAWLVAYEGGAYRKSPEDPLLLEQPEVFVDPAWWKAQNPWAVVFNTWGASRFRSLWQAAMEATPRVMDRLDTDGVRSPRVGFWLYVYSVWSRHMDAKKWWRRRIPWSSSFAQAVTHILFPGVLDRKVASAMDSLPLVTAESPEAVRKIRRFLQKLGYSSDNVQHLPHPVSLQGLTRPAVKSNRIMAVGRWDSHQKNLPMLLKVLERFFRTHTDWKADVYGALPSTANLPREGLSIRFHGNVQHSELLEAMENSRILLVTSRHESFHIAAAEALCRGCSIVAPDHIPSMQWFAEKNSGSLARSYHVNSVLKALMEECKAWDSGNRNGKHIMDIWKSKVSAEAVCRAMLDMLEC